MAGFARFKLEDTVFECSVQAYWECDYAIEQQFDNGAGLFISGCTPNGEFRRAWVDVDTEFEFEIIKNDVSAAPVLGGAREFAIGSDLHLYRRREQLVEVVLTDEGIGYGPADE